MEILNPAEASFMVEDDLLNFSLEEEEEQNKTIFGHFSSTQSTNPSSTAITRTQSQTASFPETSNMEYVEEELEWLSNKDAFPAVETCFGILSDNPELMMNHQSPVSVLESSSSSSNSNSSSKGNGSSVASRCSSFTFPKNYLVRSRSKRQRRRAGFGDLPSHQWLSQANVDSKKQESFSLQPVPITMKNGAGMGRRCLHCQADKTPQWRAGPMGPKTLCNACGVRYKSGRLLPEYRPASSPTFSSSLHSNSHRKVLEMRKQTQFAPGGNVANEACGYKVG